MQAEHDEVYAKRLELVWREAEGLVAKYEAELERFRLKYELLGDDAQTSADRRRSAELRKRLRISRERCAVARQHFQQVAKIQPPPEKDAGDGS